MGIVVQNKDINFLSFADKRLGKSLGRIKKEAERFGVFANIWVFNESDFDDWYVERYKCRFSEHGFGYWQWKAYLISRQLERMSDGDYLLYVDAGCVINERGISRFFEYIDMVDKSDSGVLAFQQGLKAKEWTKGDVFSYFRVKDLPEYTDKCQIAGGIILIRKCWNSVRCFAEWNYIAHEHHELLTDKPSVTPNFVGFVEHRHDQSVLDMLSVKYGFATVSASEIWTDKGWDTMQQFPIWAKRDKVYTELLPWNKRVKRIIKKIIKRIK